MKNFIVRIAVNGQVFRMDAIARSKKELAEEVEKTLSDDQPFSLTVVEK